MYYESFKLYIHSGIKLRFPFKKFCEKRCSNCFRYNILSGLVSTPEEFCDDYSCM